MAVTLCSIGVPGFVTSTTTVPVVDAGDPCGVDRQQANEGLDVGAQLGPGRRITNDTTEEFSLASNPNFKI